MAEFTHTQGRYLAFIHAYTQLYGVPPAESDIARAMLVSAPSVNQMVKMLEKQGLIERQPGRARSIKIRVPEDEIPSWKSAKTAEPAPKSTPKRTRPAKAVAPAEVGQKLYVVTVNLMQGPISKKHQNKVINRQIEICGDRTLHDLHEAIFEAFDRHDEHLYEFQFGKGPHDPKGTNYGIDEREANRDARKTSLDSLGLKNESVFGYWFDFGDDWYHQVQVDRIEQSIPHVTYPRIVKRVGKSPPQYDDVE